jgi:hypothetical protein
MSTMSFRPSAAVVVGFLCCVAHDARAADTAAVGVSSSPPAEVSSPSLLRLDGLNVASDNPAAAPVVTATLVNGSASAVVTLWWRSGAEEWQSRAMASGPTGLCLTRLPDGLQLTGFSFFVVATDGAGASAAVGSRAAPMEIPPASEGNAVRVARDARDADALVGPHPAFVMMALGTGVLAGAGAGVFGYDLAIVNSRLTETEAELAGGPSASRRAELVAEQGSLSKAAVQDTIATVLFGVVSGVAVVTGAVLLVVGAVEQ